MLKPSYWCLRSRTARRLDGYPAFELPVRKPAEQLSSEDMRTNLDYFLMQKSERVRALIERTSDWEVPVLIDESLDDVATRWSRFMMRYAGVCGHDRAINQQDFLYRLSGDTERITGASFVFDVGIWIGEECLKRRSKWKWQIALDKPREFMAEQMPIDPEEHEDDVDIDNYEEYGSGHGVVWLAGESEGVDPIGMCFQAANSICLGVRLGGFVPQEDVFIRSARVSYLSNLLHEWN
ncbi:MAG: hypothetical protein ABL907_12780 [Hyphomicrobium sp.]